MEDTPENRELVSVIAELTMNLYRATLVGNPAPIAKEMQNSISHPHVGDLVLEISSSRKRHPFDGRLGWLIKIAQEPYDGKWDEEIDGPCPKDDYWYIQGIDGNEHRWHNCSFIRVLDKPVDPW